VNPSDDELVVELRAGDQTRTVPVASLAAVLRLPTATIRTALARLLFASTDRDAPGAPSVLREPTEGVGDGRSDSFRSDVPPKESSVKRERNVGESEGDPAPPGIALDAETLAAALDD